jgi:hypothetical protein
MGRSGCGVACHLGAAVPQSRGRRQRWSDMIAYAVPYCWW